MRTSPPRVAEWLLTFFLKGDLLEEVLGDLDEKFYATLEGKTLFRARLNYWYQVINYLRPFALKNSGLLHSIDNSMYKNYFKIGYRNLLRNKAYSSINIIGLAVGMAVSVLIGIWVHDELSFDKYHTNYNRIAQVMEHVTRNDQVGTDLPLPIPLKAELLSKYGDDFETVILAFWSQSLIISHKEIKLTEEGNFMDNEVIETFSFKMLEGGSDALTNPGSIIISESLARKMFKDADPMGESMQIDNEMSVMVTGV
jgi:putative ABC transport system permease protein